MEKQPQSRLEQHLIDDCESRLRLFLEYSADAFYLHDLEGEIFDVNQTACDSLGYTRAELLQLNVSDIELLTALDQLQAEWRSLAVDQAHLWPGIQRRKDGSTFHVEGHNQRFEIKGRSLILALVRDVTERKLAEEQLRLAATVFNNANEGVIITDADGNIITVNQAMTGITGYSEAEVRGCNPRLWSSGHHAPSFFQDMWTSIQQTGQWRGEIWNRRKNGEVFPCWQTISSVRDETGKVTQYVSIVSDITAIKENQSEIEYLAHHDSLTGLPNRLLLNARLEHALETAHRGKHRTALIFLDLDNFKRINDSLGHLAGDRLLESVAARLEKNIREVDTVSRFGGDEFTLLLEVIQRPREASFVARKVLHIFSDPFEVEGHRLHVTPSIGISVYPEDGEDAVTLVRNADSAMYRAKEGGGGTYQFYTAEFTARASARIRMETQLRQALEHNELRIYFQPQYLSQTSQLAGAEVLIRWQHPQRGLLAPAEFIGLAEEAGLIIDIGSWVLAAACAQLKAWRDRGLDLPYLSVNVSGRQLQRDGFLDMVTHVIDETGCESKRLELEITEGFIMRQGEQSVAILQQLRDTGIAIAIDDFGTGYSSLSYLKLLPVTKLKIDRSFVRNIPNDASDKAIVKAIIALAKSLRLKVCAEGVETRPQQLFLKSAGCDEEQGYLHGRPVPAADLLELMLNRRSRGK